MDGWELLQARQTDQHPLVRPGNGKPISAGRGSAMVCGLLFFWALRLAGHKEHKAKISREILFLTSTMAIRLRPRSE